LQALSYVPGSGQHDSSQSSATTQWGYTLSDSQNGRIMVDGGGTLARRWEWEPFGKSRAESGTTPARFGYGIVDTALIEAGVAVHGSILRRRSAGGQASRCMSTITHSMSLPRRHRQRCHSRRVFIRASPPLYR